MIESMLKQTRHSASPTQEPERWWLAEETYIRNIISLMAYAPPDLFTERQRAYMKQAYNEPPQLYPVSKIVVFGARHGLMYRMIAPLCMAVISDRVLPAQ